MRYHRAGRLWIVLPDGARERLRFGGYAHDLPQGRRYCALSGDYDPHYTNEPFAEQDYYKKPVVPGGLTFIIANGLDCQTLWVDGSYIGLLDQQMSFLKPIFVGDTIYLTMTPTAKRLSRKPGRGIITYRISVFNQRDEMVMDSTWVILMATDREHME